VSATFWVPAGVAAVVSISNCGLAVGQGVWTSLIVVVSFVWGAFVFDENFRSLPMACGGALLIVIGAIGMTTFGIKKEDEHASEPTKSTFTKGFSLLAPAERPKSDEGCDASSAGVDVEEGKGSGNNNVARYASLERRGQGGGEQNMAEKHVDGMVRIESLESLVSSGNSSTDSEDRFQRLLEDVLDTEGCSRSNTLEGKPLNAEAGKNQDVAAGSPSKEKPVGDRLAWQGRGDVYVELCGFKLHRKTYGILAAVFNGLYGGSVMAPLKFAGSSASGISFVISFGIGVVGITTAMWVSWWLALKCGYVREALPSLQLKVMWLPGSISGILWALGNFCSIYAVIYLGQAVGYSSCQANIAISGAWGIFYYQEQISKKRIAFWFASAAVTIVGIVTLTLAK